MGSESSGEAAAGSGRGSEVRELFAEIDSTEKPL
jgi:hypothetical protein